MIHLLNNISAREIPEGATDVRTCYKPQIDKTYLDWLIDDNYSDPIVLDGEHVLKFTTQGASEEDWQGVVEKIKPMGKVRRYKDYEYPDSGFYHAAPSGHSLLASKGLDTNKNYCLIEKVK